MNYELILLKDYDISYVADTTGYSQVASLFFSGLQQIFTSIGWECRYDDTNHIIYLDSDQTFGIDIHGGASSSARVHVGLDIVNSLQRYSSMNFKFFDGAWQPNFNNLSHRIYLCYYYTKNTLIFGIYGEDKSSNKGNEKYPWNFFTVPIIITKDNDGNITILSLEGTPPTNGSTIYNTETFSTVNDIFIIQKDKGGKFNFSTSRNSENNVYSNNTLINLPCFINESYFPDVYLVLGATNFTNQYDQHIIVGDKKFKICYSPGHKYGGLLAVEVGDD